MKKFIKALEDRGIMKSIVNSAILTEKVTGCSVNQEGLAMILDFKMTNDENLKDIFIQEAHEIAVKSVFEYVQKQIDEKEKVEALNNVDVEELFKKATRNAPIKEESKDMNDKIEDMLLESFSRVMDDVLTDLFKNMMDDGK